MDDRAREMDRAMKIAIDAEVAYLATKDHPSKYRPNETTALAAAISAYGDEREREALKPALERIEALESLLVCYRVGKQPTEALHKKLERTRIAVESIRSVIKTAPEGETK